MNVIKLLGHRMLGENTYIAYCEDTKKGFIVDPGGNAEGIIKAVCDNGINVEYIILTHAHFDHIDALAEVKEKLGAKVCVHKLDSMGLLDGSISLYQYMSDDKKVKADILLDDEDILYVGNMKLEIIHTPGHTPGSICILSDDIMFTGDTLFNMSIGRVDFPGGSDYDMYKSLAKLMKFDKKIKVYAGHGDSTTIGYEKIYNPFIRRVDL